MIAGTRGSALAMWQTKHVASRLPGEVRIETIVTRGDVDRTSKLQGQLEKGFFTAELEAALRSGAIDFAVHSLKDLPTRGPDDLVIAAVLERAPSHDRLLVKSSGDPLPDHARVGASSLRREALLKTYFPGAEATLLRGNVPTRVRKLQDGEYDAIVLAAAGLTRLELPMTGLRVLELNAHRWIPAPGQGAIGVQCRANDEKTRAVLKTLEHGTTARATHTERELLRVFEGGCTAPFGALVEGDKLFVGAEVGGKWHALRRDVPSTPDDRFFGDTIETLSKAGTHDDDETWLHRPV